MKRLITVSVLMLLAFSTQAQEPVTEKRSSFRVGAAAAFTDYKGDPSFPIEDSGLGVDFYAQAQLSKAFAVELGYFNSGGFEQDLEPGQDEGLVEIRFGGFDLAALWYLPVFEDSDFDLFLKAGLYDFDIDIETVTGNSKVPGSLGHSTGVLAGAGFVLNISDNIGIRAVFDWYDVNNAELWALGLGAEYQF